MECRNCPVRCGADREKRVGYCGVKGLRIAKYYLHPFEEPPISFQNGSGTIFFCGCNLRCVFCQNYSLSRAERGKEISPKELSEIFLRLEDAGADNINLVSPDHIVSYIAEALSIYRPKIPVVFNSSGYVSLTALEEIDPFLDIYLPDLKFFSSALSERYTGRGDYFRVAIRAIERMAKKPVRFSKEGKLLSGLIVRHLVLPMCSSDSIALLKALKEILPENVPLSLMRQYTPTGEIEKFKELSRPITAREYRRVLKAALDLGFSSIYIQDKESAQKAFIPAWDF